MGQVEQLIQPLAKAAPLAEQQLITLDPAQYVAAVYAPLRTRLAEAVASVKDVLYDVTTPAGLRLAAECRRRFKEIRVDAEKERQARKAPVLEIGRLLDSKAKEFEKEIAPHEERFDRDIKKQEAEVESKRQAEIAAERLRVETIQERIATIIRLPLQAVGLDSKRIADLNDLLKVHADFDFQEFKASAEAEITKAGSAIAVAFSAAVAQETTAEQLRKDRVELDRKAAEQADRERVAREQREADDARQAEAQRKLDERDAELRRQQEQLDQQRAQAAPAPVEPPPSPTLVEADDAPAAAVRSEDPPAYNAGAPRLWRPSVEQMVEAVAVAFGAASMLEARAWLAEADFRSAL